MKNDKAKLKMTPVLLVFPVIFLLVTAFAFPQFALAQTFTCDAGSTVDADKDGVPAPGGPLYSQPSPCSDRYPDCNDNDPWSHRYGGKDITSVKVEYAPAYVTKMQTEKKFTPDSKKFNPLLGNLLVTVTFKTKKCGVTANSIFMPMKVYYTTKDSSGNEVSIGLQLLADTGSITASDNLVRISDLVYRGSIPGINFLTSDIESYIASVAAGRSLQLKFLGSDVGANKDSPHYYTFPQTQMTNCAQVYGGGKHKVVYMRTNDTDTGTPLNLNRFTGITNIGLYNGFNAIEPFKKYQGEFSHFIDLKQQINITALLGMKVPSSEKADARFVRQSSSCGPNSSLYFVIRYLEDTTFIPSIASGKGSRVVFLNTGTNFSEENISDAGALFIHEGGHAFAGLADEYDKGVDKVLEETSISVPTPTPEQILLAKLTRSQYEEIMIPHCTRNPNQEYMYNGKLYGRTDLKLCSVRSLFRPAERSVMGDHHVEHRFNVISCGYILKAIKKGGTAHSYFPECAAMAAKDGSIIPVGQ